MCVSVVYVLGNVPGKRAYMSTLARLCGSLRKRYALKLAGITEKKQDGHPYLEILPGWIEQY